MPRLFRRALRIKGELDPGEVEQLISQLDFDSECHQRLLPSNRRQRRKPYRAKAISIVIRQNGQDATLIVSGRNLSERGLAFILSGSLPQGTSCQARLVDVHGREQRVDAVVAHCRPVKGDLHEVGVKFVSPIDLGQFVSFSS